MEVFLKGLTDAFRLLWHLDPALLETVGLTLRVTLGALAIALLFGIPPGAAVGLARRLPGRSIIVPVIYTGMALPPVVVGLFTYLLLSIRGRWAASAGSSPRRAWSWRRRSSPSRWSSG